jgi:hypothetical protein
LNIEQLPSLVLLLFIAKNFLKRLHIWLNTQKQCVP